jgi:uncharacterized damage-inducible protein DinB
MDLLDRLLGHDAWTTRELLVRCRGLSDEALDREFDVGHRSLRRTFEHTIWNMEVWTDLMAGKPVRERAGAEGRSVEGMIARLDRVAGEFAAVAKGVRDAGRWDERWVDYPDDPPNEKTYGGAIAHVITHSMHHRAQILYLMRMVGTQNRIEGDVLSWENQLGKQE